MKMYQKYFSQTYANIIVFDICALLNDCLIRLWNFIKRLQCELDTYRKVID